MPCLCVLTSLINSKLFSSAKSLYALQPSVITTDFALTLPLKI